MKSIAPGSGNRAARRGASLIELLAAMGILSVILLMLSTALEASLGQFRTSTDRTVNRSAGRAALQWMRQDLETTVLPTPALFADTPVTASPAQRAFFSDRTFLPFEIDRVSSADGLSSLPNAVPEFGRLAFATRLAPELVFDPASDPAPSGRPRASLVGYYVAYTRNSPLAGDPAASMKLFRHLRPASPFPGDRYASGFLLHQDLEINTSPDPDRPLSESDPAAIRRGNFDNASLPTLIGRRRENRESSPTEGSPAWPALPLSAHLSSPPPSFTPDRGSLTDWQTTGSPVHDTVFPDQPVCTNVVRFEVEAFRRFEVAPGVFETLDAAGVNTHLGLNGGDEWPCLVIPDYLTITLSVISESAASTLTRYEDWIVDWEIGDPSQWSPARQRIERGLQTFTIQAHLRRHRR